MTLCPHCTGAHSADALFCPTTGKAISVSRIQEGTLVDDKYRIIRRVASGGMGAVYEVLHERIGRRMAMKFILPELAANAEVSQRFEIEARAASAIGHENIVEITDMGTTGDGLPFLVMEYLEGIDLAELLERFEVGVARTVHIVEQVLAALEAAHEQRIIHRDLKPENIFLIQRGDDPDFVKLLDFGISKFAGGEEAKLHLTSTGLILGTPYYMSPEQARGERDIDQRSDLFSVGVILYQLLTGERPFAAENLNQLLYQITSGRITSPRELNPEIPEPLERVVRKALAHEADHRFQDAASFRSALVGQRPLSTRELPPLRVATDRTSSPAATDPTLASDGVDPSARSTPLAWTGGTTRSRSTSRWLIGAGLVVVLLAAMGLALMLHRPGPKGDDHKAPTAPTATMATSPVVPTAMVAPPPRRHASDTVQVTLRLDPAGARVSVDGTVTTSRPILLQRSLRTHRLLVEADGYVSQEIELSARRDQTLVINLRPRPSRRPMFRPRRRPRVKPMRPKTTGPGAPGMKRIRAITDI